MPFINVIDYEQSEGELRKVYDNLIKSRGKLAEVHKIQSLNPESIVAHMDLYLRVMFGQSPLQRYQREMMAVVVSRTNNCPYCLAHHAQALLHFWKDEQEVQLLSEHFTKANLDEKDYLLCEFAEELTATPASQRREQLVDQLREIGFDDRSILDACLVTSYFNFVNRMVLGLGVELEDDGGAGYSYD